MLLRRECEGEGEGVLIQQTKSKKNSIIWEINQGAHPCFSKVKKSCGLSVKQINLFNVVVFFIFGSQIKAPPRFWKVKESAFTI